jgi:hypothetical protein
MDHRSGPPPFSAEVTSRWSYTSAPSVQLHGVDCGNFTLFSPFHSKSFWDSRSWGSGALGTVNVFRFHDAQVPFKTGFTVCNIQ